MVELLGIPTTEPAYYVMMSRLRQRLADIDKRQSPSALEREIGRAAPASTIARLSRMHNRQAPILEALLLETTLQQGIPLWAGIEEPGKALIQYSLRVEGRCIACYETGDDNKGLKAHTVTVGEPVTLAELQKNWMQILILDQKILEDESVREMYSPACKNGNGRAHNRTLLTSTVHGFTLLNPNGTVVLPLLKYGARTKSGLETAFKHSQWLAGEKESVPDYLASRSICAKEEFPRRVAEFMRGYITGYNNAPWDLRTQKCEDILPEFDAALQDERDLAGFFRARILPNIRIERTSRQKTAESRFLEAMLPAGEMLPEPDAHNQINHHFYKEEWYTRIEGTDLSKSRRRGMKGEDLNHLGYGAMRLTRRLDEWSPFMWLVFQKVAIPIFVSTFPEERRFAESVAARRLGTYAAIRR